VTTREALKKDIKDSQEKIHRLEEAMKIYAQRLSETEVELKRFRKDNPNLINEVPY
jgi:chromosome segregation ATPase